LTPEYVHHFSCVSRFVDLSCTCHQKELTQRRKNIRADVLAFVLFAPQHAAMATLSGVTPGIISNIPREDQK
jgi:hypothetical protein